MTALRVGVVGAGPMGQLHARTIATSGARDGDARLVMVVDRHAARARSVASEWGSQSSDDLESVVSEVDAAVVAVPTHAHFEVAALLLEAGVDVLLEKPLAASISEGERLVMQAEGRGRILQVGHVEWYNPIWRDAVERVGTPLEIQVERLHPPTGRGLDIDVVQDFMLHDLDWVIRGLGESPTIKLAQGRVAGTSGLDEVKVELVFPSGCHVVLHASRIHDARRRRLRIRGHDGEEEVDLLERGAGGGRQAPPDLAACDPLTLQWRDFRSAIRTRRPPINDGRVGLEAMRWVQRVRQAALSSGGARLDDDPDLGG